MTDTPQTPPTIVDAHVHVWDVDGGDHGVEYPWLTPDAAPLHRTYRLSDLAPHLREFRIDGIVLVQASDSIAETLTLLDVASSAPWPTAVVGWLPLDDPAMTAALLHRFRDDESLVGVRHMIHLDTDPRWLTRAGVGRSLDLLAEVGMSFDAVAERPDLLRLVPSLARRHPELTVVLDHLGKPPIASGGWDPWADLVCEIAAEPNAVAKLSGLATVSGGDVCAERWQRYVDHVLAEFGPDRTMFGSDWPFTLTAADYARVWEATSGTLSGLCRADRDAVLAGTARRVYQFTPPAEMAGALRERSEAQ